MSAGALALQCWRCSTGDLPLSVRLLEANALAHVAGGGAPCGAVCLLCVRRSCERATAVATRALSARSLCLLACAGRSSALLLSPARSMLARRLSRVSEREVSEAPASASDASRQPPIAGWLSSACMFIAQRATPRNSYSSEQSVRVKSVRRHSTDPRRHCCSPSLFAWLKVRSLVVCCFCWTGCLYA